MNRPTAILFDLDGTLVDRDVAFEPYAQRFMAHFQARLGEVTLSEVRRGIVAADDRGYRPKGEMALHLLDSLPWIDPPTPGALERFRQEVFVGLVGLQGGALALLSWLAERGYRLGLVTNGSVRSQTRKLQATGIERFFEAVVISEAIKVKKPKPRAFAACLEELGVDASAAWYVGDHPVNDVIGARDAGLTPVWVSGGFAWPDAHERPDRVISRVGDLQGLLS